jgi:lipoate-protein ligase A
VSDGVRPLRNYGSLRRRREFTLETIEVTALAVVLGSSQNANVLGDIGSDLVLRRRGGGGVVLLRPGDLWIDAWIPGNDPRWTHDVLRQSIAVGEWWRSAIRAVSGHPVEVHARAASAGPAPVVCFAALSPGEVVLDGAKVVGLTQWRVREGALVSGVLPRSDSRELAGRLASPVDPLSLQHPSQESLGLAGRERDLEVALQAAAGLPVAVIRSSLS